MIRLKSFILSEAVVSKNTHMTHIEELLFVRGLDGTKQALKFFEDLREMLRGNSSNPIDITVKWDGAPAVFVGVDPTDGKFFVAKKGLFNKNPEMYKTPQDIKKDLSGDLFKKFNIALEEFSKLGIKKGVFQGDMMFTKGDVKVETIEGEKFYTFQPNTIVYAVPVKSKLGQQISRARIGVVWHTTYTGRTITTMKASFGKGIVDKFKKASSIWMDDATYRDISGKAVFDKKESTQFDKMLDNANKQFSKMNREAFRTISDDDELRQKVMTFVNSFIRAGKDFPAANKMAVELVHHLNNWFQKEIDKKKTDKGKEVWKKRRDVLVNKVVMNKSQLVAMFELMKILVDLKQMVIGQLNKTQEVDTLLRTSKGFVVTKQEGFVAIDKLKGGAVKLIDRHEFSRANFSPDVIKGWQK